MMGAAIESVRAERYTWWRALRASSLTPTARHVALAIATYMDADGGGAWPSMATLSDDTGRSRRTVARAVQELEQAGYLDVSSGGGRRGDGGYVSNRYVATIPPELILPPIGAMGDSDAMGDTPADPPDRPGAVSSEPGAVSSQHGAVSPMTGSGVTHGTRGTQELAIQEPNQEPPSSSTAVDGALDPFAMGRRFADHVTAGRMTRQDAVRAAGRYGHEDRLRFLDGLDPDRLPRLTQVGPSEGTSERGAA